MMIRTGTKNLHRFARLNQELRRSFASQTLLSRTDFQNKSTVELREELSKRGIVTGSKKKSILIDKILEDERRRMSSSSPPPRKKGPPSVGRSGTEEVGGSLRSSTSTWGNRWSSAPIQTGSESAALATPKLTMRSEGHQAQVWPASINIPSTPVEEPMGTMIPFIPNNWSSHQQSHAPKMVDLKPSSAEVSTASHPSTLPEGGPTRVVTDRFSPSTDSSSDASQGLANKTGQYGPDEIIFNYLASISLPSFQFSSKKDSSHQSPHPQDEFKFEDRPLNDRERNGLYQVLAFFGGSWLVAGLFDSH
ncbi:hypothetical protein H4Q26_015478 [Puccinia striiformis f. sp. tritici PST-130]|nr:hypothetical protein H4Q26_015478 [Puccinia striiformis f. sp. tritici PST-130]